MPALKEPRRIVFTGTRPQMTSYTLHPSDSSVSQHLHFGSSSPKVCGLNRVMLPEVMAALQLPPEKGQPKRYIHGSKARKAKTKWFLKDQAAGSDQTALAIAS